MNKFLHGMVQRTCGRDNGDTDDSASHTGSDVIGVYPERSRRTGAGNVSLTRCNREAANDAHYQAERRVA